MFGCDRSHLTGWERYANILQECITGNSGVEVGVISSPASDKTIRRAAEAAWHFSHLHRLVENMQADVYHSPSFPLIGQLNIPTIWSVHDDIIVGGHPRYASRGTRYWKLPARRCLAVVDAVVTFTNSSARDLERAGADSARIHVIGPPQPDVPPPGPPPLLVDAHGDPATFPQEFLLAVGTIEPRKRPALAAEIAASVKTPLVFVGRPRGIDTRDLPGHPLFAFGADNAQLSWCYENARALMAVSAYEGIDLPLFEALSTGLPVLASPVDVHTELAAGHVTFLNEADPIRSSGEALLNMPSRGDRVRLLSSRGELGSAHAKLYKSILAA